MSAVEPPSAAVVLGTRPEIIKLAPVIRALRSSCLRPLVIHSNQHYTSELDAVFFRQLELAPADVNLDVGSAPHGAQTGRMLERLEAVLMERRPQVVIVQGDTNTVLAGALAAAKLEIPVAHVEAGLRSYDRAMPEEVNRVVADHVASYLFAPTEAATRILVGEGIADERIWMTGNTVVDAIRQHGDLAPATTLDELGVEPEQFYLLTLHRPENTDSDERLVSIVEKLRTGIASADRPILFPVHPRTERTLKRLGLWSQLQTSRELRVLPPLGYLEFLALEKSALCVVTDSGGVQEESCILGVPCVTIRTSTERPETIEIGANRLADGDASQLIEAVQAMQVRRGGWEQPYGDGTAGRRIVRQLEELGGAGRDQEIGGAGR